MNNLQEIKITLNNDNTISPEDKRALITIVMLASNRIFMESKLGPADTCEFHGNDIHFLLPVFKNNNMMKTMQFETLSNNSLQSFIKITRTVNIKDKDKPKIYEQIINIKFKSVIKNSEVIDSSFFTKEGDTQIKVKDFTPHNFKPGVLLFPNGNSAEGFIYWSHIQLDPNIDYEECNWQQRALWEKKKGMMAVKTFSSSGKLND